MSRESYFPYDLPVEFAGLESTLGRMKHAGWDMMKYEDYRLRQTHIAMRHLGLEVHAITDDFDLIEHGMAFLGQNAPMFSRDPDRGFMERYGGRYGAPRIRINVIAKDVQWSGRETARYMMLEDPMLHVPISKPYGYLSELPWFNTFAAPAVPEPETGQMIYVPDAEISDLMDIILKKQAPKQAEIRERLRKEENRSKIIKPEATIIKLFA